MKQFHYKENKLLLMALHKKSLSPTQTNRLKKEWVHYYLKLKTSSFGRGLYIFPYCQRANCAYFVIMDYTSSSAGDAIVNCVYILSGNVCKAPF